MNATIEVRAPQDQSEGTRSQVQRWLKAVGENVAEHEPLIEVETDKVTIEIPAPASGVLQRIVKQEQEEIAPGELLAVIEAGQPDEGAVVAASPAKNVAQSPGESIRTAALTAHMDALAAGRSSPAVRRLLAEHNLDAADIRGTGAGGRVTVDDVLSHISSRSAKREAQIRSRVDLDDTQSLPVARRIPHTTLRRRIAERMVDSLLHTAPHVTTVFEADMSAVIAHRAKHRADFQQRGASLTFTAYFLAACADAIAEVPEVNSRWSSDALLLYDAVNIGVGTAVEGKGLMVPVVRNVQSMGLLEIARELGNVVTRARQNRLVPQDVSGGTFTISNHGVSGSLVATPIIINQPQSAILGVGKLEKRAVVVTEHGEDRIVVRPRCYVTLTLDHRVMDGERANRFLAVLVQRLESWKD